MEKCEVSFIFVLMNYKRTKRTDNTLTDMIIKRIKELRETHNHSQEYVIENTGLDIAHFETGRDVPSVISLSILCKFYRITLDEFFAPMNYPPKE